MNTVNEQHQLYENARRRVVQKKRLYTHFVLLLVGAVILFVVNKVFKVGESFMENWYVWAILLWCAIWVLHAVNVIIINRFMGKDWERKQIEELVLKQELKIARLEKKVVHDERLTAENEQDTSELKKKKSP